MEKEIQVIYGETELHRYGKFPVREIWMPQSPLFYSNDSQIVINFCPLPIFKGSQYINIDF